MDGRTSEPPQGDRRQNPAYRPTRPLPNSQRLVRPLKNGEVPLQEMSEPVAMSTNLWAVLWAEIDPGHWFDVDWLPADVPIVQALVDNL